MQKEYIQAKREQSETGSAKISPKHIGMHLMVTLLRAGALEGWEARARAGCKLHRNVHATCCVG